MYFFCLYEPTAVNIKYHLFNIHNFDTICWDNFVFDKLSLKLVIFKKNFHKFFCTQEPFFSIFGKYGNVPYLPLVYKPRLGITEDHSVSVLHIWHSWQCTSAHLMLVLSYPSSLSRQGLGLAVIIAFISAFSHVLGYLTVMMDRGGVMVLSRIFRL